MPKVSVVMAVYNERTYVSAAVESILSQTLEDFEFIIIDDGSYDGTGAIMQKYAGQDRRVRLLRNSCNLGLIASLNKGVREARGTYIARQDGDDISLPQRLESQVDFLESHPKIGVVGTWLENVDQSGRKSLWRTYTDDYLVKWSLLFSSSIAHATVMMRKSLVDGEAPFRPEMMHAEDYDLWTRLCDKTAFANIPVCHYLRRLHDQRVSIQHQTRQEQTVDSIMQTGIEQLLGRRVSEELVGGLRRAHYGRYISSPGGIRAVADLVIELYGAFVDRYGLDAAERKEVAYDAACLLTRMALRHARTDLYDSARIFTRAVRLAGRIPYREFYSILLQICTKANLSRVLLKSGMASKKR